MLLWDLRKEEGKVGKKNKSFLKIANNILKSQFHKENITGSLMIQSLKFYFFSLRMMH